MADLKVHKIHLTNYKGSGDIEIDLKGKSVWIIGANASGKTSLLGPLASLLDSKEKPEVPIAVGEKRASHMVELIDEETGEKFIPETYFTPGNPNGRLELTSSETGKVTRSVATFLKSLINYVAIDPFDFLKKSPAKKVEYIKSLIDADFTELDIRMADLARKRTYTSQRADDLRAFVKEARAGYTDGQIEVLSDRIEIEPIQEEMIRFNESRDKIRDAHSKFAILSQNIENIKSNISHASREMESVDAEIKRLQTIKETLEKNLASHNTSLEEASSQFEKGKTWIEKNPVPSDETIQKKLANAIVHNKDCDSIESLITKNKELLSTEEEFAKIEEDIKTCKSEQSKLIKESEFPVKSISFDENNVYYNGLPFERNQINDGKIVEIWTEIMASQKMGLKLLRIKDGSLLDRDTLAYVYQMAKAKNMQLIVEMVDWEAGPLRIVMEEEFDDKLPQVYSVKGGTEVWITGEDEKPFKIDCVNDMLFAESRLLKTITNPKGQEFLVFDNKEEDHNINGYRYNLPSDIITVRKESVQLPS